MELKVRAVYENGCFRPLHPVPLPEAQQVELTIATPKPRETEDERKARIERARQAVENFKARDPIQDPELLRMLALDPQLSVENIPLAAEFGIEAD